MKAGAMPDDRVTAIRRHLKKARSHVMRAAREADRWNPTLHWRLMLACDVLDDAGDANDDVDTKLRLMEAAYDSDTVDTARRERRR